MLTGDTLPFWLVMSFASSLSLLFSGNWYVSCHLSLAFCTEGKTVRKA